MPRHSMRFLATLFALLGTLALQSCAAVFGSKSAEVTTVSEPPGADVYLDGNRLGTTPVQVRLLHKRSHTLVFRKAGYRDATCHLQSSTRPGWVILDVLAGLVPVIVDAATGDWSQISDKHCAVSLPTEAGVPAIAAGPVAAPAENPRQSAAPPPSMAPSPAAFVSSAPGEIVSEAARSNRRTVVNTMLRLGTVNAVEQGPPGILRTAIGETFHTSNIREYHYTKLATAYHTWTAEEEGTLVIELWERGQKIGEYSDGAFLMGPGYSTPLDCAGPGAAGICGAIAPVGQDPLTPAPAPGTSEPIPVTPPPSPIPIGAAEPRSVPAATESDVPRGHRGFHFGLGLGSGSAGLSCGTCDFSRETALSGYLSLSSSIGKNMLLGIESTGWTHELETGSDAQVYSLMAVLTGYMNERSGFFLRTGAGLVGYREDSELGDIRANGFGFSGRLGYELGKGSVTVIPYVGYMGTFGYPTFTLGDADYAELAISNIQLGLALGIQ